MSKNTELAILQEKASGQSPAQDDINRNLVTRKSSLSWFPNSEIQEAISYITANNSDALKQLLAANKISPSSEIRKGYTLLNMARDRGNYEVKKLLEDWHSVPYGKLEAGNIQGAEFQNAPSTPMFHDQVQSVKQSVFAPQVPNSTRFAAGLFNEGDSQNRGLPNPRDLPVVFMSSKFVYHTEVKFTGDLNDHIYQEYDLQVIEG